MAIINRPFKSAVYAGSSMPGVPEGSALASGHPSAPGCRCQAVKRCVISLPSSELQSPPPVAAELDFLQTLPTLCDCLPTACPTAPQNVRLGGRGSHKPRAMPAAPICSQPELQLNGTVRDSLMLLVPSQLAPGSPSRLTHAGSTPTSASTHSPLLPHLPSAGLATGRESKVLS